MRNGLNTFLSNLESVTRLDQIQDLIVGLRDELAVDHVIYHWISVDGQQYGFGTYDPTWAQRYQDMDYIRVDPVVLGCFQRFHPVDWKRLDWTSRAARAFRAESLTYQVGNQGYSVPIRGPNGQFALFSLSRSCSDEDWDDFIATHQRDVIVLAHYLNAKALQLENHRTPDPVKPLSPREVDALTFLAMGYSRGQAADMLAISEHTLRDYIESARLKLGAANIVHAVARALTEGLILTGGAARDDPGGWPGRLRDPLVATG
ncbi:regulatory protein, luxR family [Loktanella fryxellensis]|uniref:Regulatory protein, luxR family n=1 Tax=Loktanella fryxellensis TaxID=245187 RepID=A0A1H8DE49_9RHOB|nr:LuxR family transcriptional regulator [Loktanella fryxellensis]SEN05631.1 regulatory protein, luxR family [Loktanella fryxellensis]